ncbi:MAG: hypothetical protein V7L13_24080 [Nostoc sp.]
MIEADAKMQRRKDMVIICYANSKIIPQLCNTKSGSGDRVHA